VLLVGRMRAGLKGGGSLNVWLGSDGTSPNRARAPDHSGKQTLLSVMLASLWAMSRPMRRRRTESQRRIVVRKSPTKYLQILFAGALGAFSLERRNLQSGNSAQYPQASQRAAQIAKAGKGTTNAVTANAAPERCSRRQSEFPPRRFMALSVFGHLSLVISFEGSQACFLVLRRSPTTKLKIAAAFLHSKTSLVLSARHAGAFHACRTCSHC